VTCTVHPLYSVVSDVRFADSAEFGLEAERLGVHVVRISGDITGFWFNDLSMRWRDHAVAIAGMTAHGPLFCLERFAWDHGMRVVFRGTHLVLDAHHVAHALTGPSGTIARAQTLGLEGPDWARDVARLVSACEVAGEPSSAELMTVLATGGRDDMPEPLVSWVIAPACAGALRSLVTLGGR